jgi:hypothetical protein
VYGVSIYSVVALWLSVTLGAIGAVQLVGPRFVREAYRRWGYGPRVRLVTGFLDLAAAIMLAMPEFRGWGIVLAAILTFGSVVVFLNHCQYRYALPTVGLMIALVPAAAAVPRQTQFQLIVQDRAPQAAQTVMASDDGVSSNLSIERPGVLEPERRAF